ncbi:MAG: O-antigen ligase family protein [Candidatus Daviesbacteria bacterium]|nr:O-antigen ligase family protein [Candidatus Daviesbacteria bacterium]
MAFLTPLFFWSYTTEFYETPKFILVLIATTLFLLLWITKWITSGKITLTISKLDLSFFLLLIAFIISTFFAASKPIAIFGALPRLHGGLVSFTLYAVFYFVLAANLKKISTIKEVVYALLASSIILSILSLLSYAGINLFSLPWTAGQAFTPTGSSFSTVAILLLILPFPISAILYGSKLTDFDSDSQNEELGLPLNSLIGSNNSLNQISIKVIWSVILGLFTTTIVLIGNIPLYIAAVIVLVLVLFVTPPNLISRNSAYLFIPILVSLLIAFISFMPIGGSKNILYNKAQSFPRELQLPFSTSWKISISAFRDSPFYGSGPASYLNDFTLYKPAEFNNTAFWSAKFDQAFNEYLQILATLGTIGLIALVLLTVTALAIAFKSLSTPKTGSIRIPLAISTITFFIVLALHASTLTLWIVGIILIVCFLAITRQSSNEIVLGDYQSNSTNGSKHNINPLPIIAALVIVGLGFLVYKETVPALIADYHHRQALKAVSVGQGLVAYNELILAEKFNPNIDLYRSDLAQTNFALANAIASAKGPTETNPSGSLSDQDKQNIQVLLSQAINEGRAATILNPNNSANWVVLASIYQQISGVAKDALQFALDSYGRAIQKDPFNPVLRLTVGGVYYQIKNYDMAIRFFSDAANLKPDYANAYYNLAIAYKDKGDLANATLFAEQAISKLDAKSPDYKTATDLLEQLKTKQVSNTPKVQTESSSSALQDQNLPKVLNLPKPEKITTPSAIKKTIPTPTPNPEP